MPNDAAARAECARVIRAGQRRFLQVLTLGEISLHGRGHWFRPSIATTSEALEEERR
jgi:hypothetical protein